MCEIVVHMLFMSCNILFSTKNKQCKLSTLIAKTLFNVSRYKIISNSKLNKKAFAFLISMSINVQFFAIRKQKKFFIALRKHKIFESDKLYFSFNSIVFRGHTTTIH